MSVKTLTLSEIAEINPSLGVSLDETDEVSFVPMGAFSEVTASVVAEEIRQFGQVKKGFTGFRSGDVIFAKITPCFENGKIGLANISRDVGFGSTEFHVIRARPEMADPRFLHHFLRLGSVRLSGTKRMTGSAGQRRVPKSFLESLPVPALPLDEQRRIAAMFDKAEELRAKRRAAIALLDQLLHAIFLEMFGDPTSNPNGWPNTTKLAEVSEPVSGITKGRKINGKAMREIPYLAVVNVQDRHLNLNTVKTIEATEEEIERYRLLPGDLLLTEGGDPDKLGRGSLWNGELPEAIHQNHIFRVRVTSPALTPLYLSWLIGSSYGKTYFLRQAKQTTGIATINMGQLKAFPLLLPPLELQHQFAARVEAIHGAKAAHLSVLANIDSLFASLQNRAFAGGLS